MFNNQVIFEVKSTGRRSVIYKDDLEAILEDNELTKDDVETIPFSKATPTELVNFISNTAESANYHEFIGMVEDIHKGLQREGFSKKEQRKILLILADAIGSMI